jgi:hypothetical protein
VLFGAMVVAWGHIVRQGIYDLIIINVQLKAANQPHLAPGGIHYVRKSVCIRVIRGIRVLSFVDGSVLLRMVVAWGSYRAPGYLLYTNYKY